MLSFLFWNISKNSIAGIVAGLALERDIDLVILAECSDPLGVLNQLNQAPRRIYFHEPSITGKLHFFSCLPQGSVRLRGEYGGLTFAQVSPPIGKDFLLVGVHLPSKLYMSAQDQLLDCTSLAKKIDTYEERAGHHRTLVVGDFNLNPFEDGLIAAHGFHAASSKSIAKRLQRTVRGESYRFFYNPMWSHFGDRGPCPPGTYYYERSSATDRFWNIFDQLLLRPELLDSFDDRASKLSQPLPVQAC